MRLLVHVRQGWVDCASCMIAVWTSKSTMLLLQRNTESCSSTSYWLWAKRDSITADFDLLSMPLFIPVKTTCDFNRKQNRFQRSTTSSSANFKHELFEKLEVKMYIIGRTSGESYEISIHLELSIKDICSFFLYSEMSQKQHCWR